MIVLEVHGHGQLDALIDRVYDLGRKMQTEGMRVLGGTIRDQMETRVETTKRDPDGQPWAPWSQSYAETRGPQHSLLVDTQALLKSFQDPGAQVYSGSKAEIGTAIPYADRHQLGKDVTPRPFAGVGTKDLRELEVVLQGWLDSEVDL